MKVLVRAILVCIGCFVHTSRPAMVVDESFGFEGVAAELPAESVKKLIVQPDGKIIALSTEEGDEEYEPATLLLRYNSDGSTDENFDTENTVQTVDSLVADVKLLPDGTIVTVHFLPERLIVSCYDLNGSPITDLTVLPAWLRTWVEGNDIVLQGITTNVSLQGFVFQPDGGMIVCGYFNDLPSRSVGFLTRYLSTRTADRTFGGNGDGTVINPRSSGFVEILLQSDTTFVVNDGNNVWRYTAQGGLDAAFGDAGRVTGNGRIISAIAVQQDGKVVIGKTSMTLSSLERYLPDGTLDTTFGIDGIGFSKSGADGSLFSSVAVQPDGKIVVVEDQGDEQQQILTRYRPVEATDIEARIFADALQLLMFIDAEERPECAICYGSLSAEYPSITQTPCGHFFCREELARWRNSEQGNANTCPLCRTPLE